MDHLQDELARIEARLAAYPLPHEHAGLYAAQQALTWALDPSACASSYEMVTNTVGVSEGYSGGRSRPPLSGSSAHSHAA